MPVNLATVELKLLVVFDAVLAERSVTRAARRLGMSQPAVSSALNRFRALMNDELLLRTSAGMHPTPKAQRLAIPVQRALRQLESALEPTSFHPLDVDWTFNLAISDHASVIMLPLLLEHMSEVAPRVRLQVTSKRNVEVSDLLDSNEADIAIGVIPDLPPRFSRVELFDDHYVCVMRRSHPSAGRPLSREDLSTLDHLAVRPGSYDVSQADRLLDRYGVKRRAVTTVHQFLAAPGIIARSDMVVLVFERMTGVFDTGNFHFCPVPVPDMTVRVDAVWNRVRTNQAAHRWLRSQIVASCGQLQDSAEATILPGPLPMQSDQRQH